MSGILNLIGGIVLGVYLEQNYQIFCSVVKCCVY